MVGFVIKVAWGMMTLCMCVCVSCSVVSTDLTMNAL